MEISGKVPSVFKELFCPINSHSANYHESVTDRKEAMTTSLNGATHRMHQKLMCVLRRMSKYSQVVNGIL